MSDVMIESCKTCLRFFFFLLSILLSCVSFVRLDNVLGPGFLVLTVIGTIFLPLWHARRSFRQVQGSFLRRATHESGKRLWYVCLFVFPLLVIAGMKNREDSTGYVLLWIIGLSCVLGSLLDVYLIENERQNVDLRPLTKELWDEWEGNISLRKGSWLRRKDGHYVEKDGEIIKL